MNEPAPPFVPWTEDRRPAPATPFERLLHTLLDELFAAYPTFATQVGDHRFDHLWPDYTEAGRRERVAVLRRWHATLGALPERELSPDERVDLGILEESLEAFLFEEDELRQLSWDPLEYVGALGSGLFQLLGREFAPWSHRGGALAERIAGIPAVVAAARETLTGLPGRPVSRLHAETALDQLGGVGELIDEAIATAETRLAEAGGAAVRLRLEAVAPLARDALEAFRQFVAADVMPRAEGEGRLGAALFDQKLRHAMASDLSREEIQERAGRDVVAVRAEMLRLARRLWARWVPEEPLPPDPRGASPAEAAEMEDRIVRRVLDAIAAEHQSPETLLDFCRAEVGRSRGSVATRRGSSGSPRSRSRSTWTPAFLRAFGGAMLDSPGPLDTGPAELLLRHSAARRLDARTGRVRLREDNDRMLRPLCIHEAVPGHYLQLATRTGPIVRSGGLLVGRLRRGVGALRDPGDDGPAGTGPTIRRSSLSTGSSTCGP